ACALCAAQRAADRALAQTERVETTIERASADAEAPGGLRSIATHLLQRLLDLIARYVGLRRLRGAVRAWRRGHRRRSRGRRPVVAAQRGEDIPLRQEARFAGHAASLED